jgi:hypothetical protein
MKTAVSIPDEVFKGAEELARHAAEDITDAMDRVCAALGHPADEFVLSAARRILERSEW